MKEHRCRDCDAIIERVAGRPGRPPIRCASCREQLAPVKKASTVQIKDKLTPEEKVDRLEMLLKSAGLHISQWDG